MQRASLPGLVLSISLIVTALISSASFATSPSISTSYNALYHIERSSSGLGDLARAKKISSSYDRLLAQWQSPKTIRSTSSSNLVLLFRGAYIAQFYSYELHYVSNMESDLAELTRRNAATSDLYIQMYRAFISTRQFEKAKRLADADMIPPDIPNFQFQDMSASSDSARTVMALQGDNTLLRKPVNITHGAHIVVIAHPLCHFSQNAVSYISANPRLNDKFRDYAVWIAPPEGDLELDIFKRWNADHPEKQMELMYRPKDWPELGSFETPVFYFFKDGKLLKTVSGWPKEGNAKELDQGLMSIGIN